MNSIVSLIRHKTFLKSLSQTNIKTDSLLKCMNYCKTCFQCEGMPSFNEEICDTLVFKLNCF
jgi:hypothetical protein